MAAVDITADMPVPYLGTEMPLLTGEQERRERTATARAMWAQIKAAVAKAGRLVKRRRLKRG
jgi:hypothetical protein